MKHRPFIWSPPALLLAALLAQPAAAAAPPALDCARAAQPMDTLVCRDPGLAALDRETTRLYGVARATLIGRRLEGLDETQRARLLRRNDCRNAVDPRACVLAIQLDRIATLRQHHAVTRAPAERGTSRGPVAFDCGGHRWPPPSSTASRPWPICAIAGSAMPCCRRRRPAASATPGPRGSTGRQGTEAAITLPDRTELTCRERGR